MKRCVSKCSGIKEEACKEPCSFVNKKFCRLSTQYKMGDYPGCEVTKKVSKPPSKLTQKVPLKSEVKPVSLIKTRPLTHAKTVKSKVTPKTVAKKTPIESDTNLNHISKLTLNKMKTIPDAKRQILELHKRLEKVPSDTLINKLDESTQTSIHTLVQTLEGGPSHPFHPDENISNIKKFLNNVLSKRDLVKTKPKSATKAKTATNTHTKKIPLVTERISNNVTNLVLKKMKSTKTSKQVLELYNIMDKLPPDTLFSSLEPSIQAKVVAVIKTIDEVSPSPPHPEETILNIKKVLHKIMTKRQESSARTIYTFMKKTEERRKALFYGTICTESGVCIALGKERQALLNFFKFDTFEHAKEPYKSVGTPSANGFVKELKYEREGYVAYALLKSSLKPRSDNLAYEYLVGKYLNEVSKKLPNFVETYGLFHYPSTKERDEMKLNHRFSRPVVPFDPNDMKNVCRKAQNMCVLSQYLKDTKSFLHHYEDPYFRKHFSPYVFYQIYFTLHRLRKEFTHYDLHCNNILLYEPMDGQYIQYHYHCHDKVVSFKSKYIVKIIDYGRCFFKNSLEYYKKICAEKTCDPLCGLKKGFSTFHMDRNLDRFVGFSNSAFKNESQDLLPLYDTYLHSKVITDDSLDPDYRKILSDTIYLKGMYTMRFNGKTFDKKFGTIEDLSKSDKIHNVTDACERWEEYILHPDRLQSNEQDFVGQRCLGELHIYTDGRDLEFNILRDPFTNLD
jgi:hypothetical protein